MPLIDLNGLGHFKAKENAMVADSYSASKTYAVGDYVYYNGTLYRCTTAITTAEAWTAGHWTAAKLGDDCSSLKTALNEQIIISNTEPVSENNKIWIDSTATSVQIPTMEDFTIVDKIIDMLPTKTISGDIAHFTDGADGIPVKSVDAELTATKLYTAGKNLFDSSNLLSAYQWEEEDGVYTGYAQNIDVSEFGNFLTVPFDAGQITISFDGYVDSNSRAGYFRFGYTDGTSEFLEFTGQTWKQYEKTSNANKTVSSVYFGKSNNVRCLLKNIQIELATDKTTYEEFKGNVYDVDDGEINGTVLTLGGENNIWTDSGDVEVTYHPVLSNLLNSP